MAGDSAEERNLPPTQRKLRKMRREGQVATSKEFVSIAVFVFIFAYAFLFATTIYKLILAYFSDVFGRSLRPDALDAGTALSEAVQVAGNIIGPLGVLTLAGAVLASALIMRGFPFSLKPLAIKMDRLSPASGLKQILSVRNLIDLVQSLLKFLICFAIIYLYVTSYLSSLFWSPLCGAGCTVSLFQKMAAVAVGLILLGMVVIVLMDIKLSNWLFMRDAKMGIAELKRDLKEEHGDPRIKQAMREEGQRLTRIERRYSFEDAHFLILGHGIVIGIYFERGVSAAPIIASISADQEGQFHRRLGDERKLLHYTDPDLALDLAQKGRAGRMVPFEFFDRTARAMVRSGFLS